MRLTVLSMIKRHLRGFKYALGLAILNMILFWRTGSFNIYIWNIAAIIALLGIITPVIIDDVERILYCLIRLMRIILTFLLIGFIHLIIFPLIRLFGFIFGRHFTFTSIKQDAVSYFSDKENYWKENMNEPF